MFTTLRIYRGVPFAFERHWDRLQRDASLLHVEMPARRDALRSQLMELVTRNGCPDCKLRLNIMRSQGGPVRRAGFG